MIARSPIVYSEGYKYQLKENFSTATILRPAQRVEIPGFVLLDTDGDLYISAGYAWDGPSGPAYDFQSDMAASLVHDALCQLIIEGKLPKEMKPEVDRMLRDIMEEDGANRLRSLVYEKAVNKYGSDYLVSKEVISIMPGGEVSYV